jgi:hypothetical protein
VAYYGILRADAVVVPVNPMNRADEFTHYITDAQARFAICSADLAAIVDQANQMVPSAERLKDVVVTRYTDLMPEGVVDVFELIEVGEQERGPVRPAGGAVGELGEGGLQPGPVGQATQRIHPNRPVELDRAVSGVSPEPEPVGAT